MSAPFRAPSGYELTGLIERVTFFSEESGFCVLQVKAEGHRDLVTVVGSAPAVSAGEWLIAQGDWVVDKQHGRQLKAFHLRTMLVCQFILKEIDPGCWRLDSIKERGIK